MAGSTDKIMLIAAFVSSFFIFIGIITTTLFLTSEDKSKLIEVKDISKGKLLPEGLIGRYNASSLKTNSWDDLSGKSNHIKSENIKGIDKIKKGFGFKGEYVYGGTDTSIELPQEFKATNWTFFAVARYNGPNRGRIFTTKKPVADTDINWLAGFDNGKTGIAYYGGGGKGREDDKTNGYLNKKYDATAAPDGVSYTNDNTPNSLHGQNTWILLMSTKSNFRTFGKNRHDSGAAGYAVAPEKFGINLWETEESDWAIYEMLVFDKWLADDRIVEVETYLREKYILADLSTGIDYKKGKPTLTPKTLDFFGTNEECRLHAREQGSKMWGRNTDKHDTNDDRNKCFFYDDHVPVDDTDKFEGDDEDVKTVTGCVEKGKDVSTYCTTKKEGRYGPGVDTSGVCKVVEGSGGSFITDDKIQSQYCDDYVNKPQCEEGKITVAGDENKDKSDFCRWDNTISPSPSTS
mgnify:CR=1 FL=1